MSSPLNAFDKTYARTLINADSSTPRPSQIKTEITWSDIRNPGTPCWKEALRVIAGYAAILTVVPGLLFLAWKGCRWIADRIVVSASNYSKDVLDRARASLFDPDKKYMNEGQLQRIKLTTSDNRELDGVLFTPTSAQPGKLIFHTNSRPYEFSFEAQIQRSIELRVPVMMINHRGVGESTGSPTPDGIAHDVATVYHFANKQLHVTPSNVLLHGASFGGVYGNMGAALVQAETEYQYEEISVINERSISDFSTKVSAMYEGRPFVSILARFFLWMTGWTMDSKAAMDRLKGRKLIVHLPEGVDKMVPHRASMRQAVQPGGQTYSFELHAVHKEGVRDHQFKHDETENAVINYRMRQFLGLEQEQAAYDNEHDLTAVQVEDIARDQIEGRHLDAASLAMKVRLGLLWNSFDQPSHVIFVQPGF